MKPATQNFIGWFEVIFAILIVLNQTLSWPSYLEYVWALLVLIAGIWTIVAKD